MSVQGCMLAALLLVALMGESHGARILGLFPFPAKSHMISYSALTRELAKRGHDVTVVSAFPQDPPLANYTDIVMEDTFHEKQSMDIFTMKDNKFGALFFFWYMGTVTCDRALQQPSIQKLIHAKDLHFDLIIMSGFLSECFTVFAHKFKAPTIHISPNTDLLVMGSLVGNPHTFSYVPNSFLSYSDHMNFCERMLNTIFGVSIMLVRDLYYLPKQDAIARKYFDDPQLPSIAQLECDTSFLLLNSHVIFNTPRPFTPNTAEVGGMHIKPPKKLPKDLQKFLDDAPDGVIYFSLGSNVRSADMPEDKRHALLEAFSALKQKVLWKWETDVLPGQPANVHLGKWLPQNDILGHPNVRVFITHGGLLSTQEAVYHGTPVLAVPVFGDQMMNAEHAQKAGYGLRVDFMNISLASVSWALDQLLNQPSYRENVKRQSKIFHDQPQTPLERGVFWTEYILRHKGAQHMHSAAHDLAWYQYHLLDVLAVILGGTAIILTMMYLSCRTVFRCLLRRRSKMSKAESNRSKKTN